MKKSNGIESKENVRARMAFRERYSGNGTRSRHFSPDEAKGWIDGYAEGLKDALEYASQLEASHVMLEAKALVLVQGISDVAVLVRPLAHAEGSDPKLQEVLQCCSATLFKVATSEVQPDSDEGSTV